MLVQKIFHPIVNDPRYSTTDHWIQEYIKRIFNSGLFWAVGAAERKKNPNCHKYATTFETVFYDFIKKEKKEKIKGTLALALKSYIA